MFEETPESSPESEARYTKVFGVSHRNPDGSERQDLIRQCRVFDILSLRHDPENEHDSCAVEVHRLGVGQIGFIGRHLNAEIVSHIEDGGQVYTRIIEITGGSSDKPTLGVNIEIVLSEPDDETTYEPELVDGEWMGEFSAPCAVVILLVFVLVIAVTC